MVGPDLHGRCPPYRRECSSSPSSRVRRRTVRNGGSKRGYGLSPHEQSGWVLCEGSICAPSRSADASSHSPHGSGPTGPRTPSPASSAAYRRIEANAVRDPATGKQWTLYDVNGLYNWEFNGENWVNGGSPGKLPAKQVAAGVEDPSSGEVWVNYYGASVTLWQSHWNGSSCSNGK